MAAREGSLRTAPRAVLLMGPTASGKSRLALELAARFPVEVVSVDSAQVYRGMDIGTAKPGAVERRTTPHHLIDILDPTGSYSAARFCADATQAMDEIAARGRLPLLVGGTMLYFKALRDGLSRLPPADPVVRASIEAAARERGWPALHAELAGVDPITARRLEPADAQRIQRALEVFQITGMPLSHLIGDRHPAPPPFVQLALVPSDRSKLHRRIAARFLDMLAAGLVDELRSLRERYSLHPALASMRCVGYRQAWKFIEGEYALDELRDRGIFATRQLAKRQLTWLRSTSDLITLDCEAETLMCRAAEAIERSAMHSHPRGRSSVGSSSAN